MPSRRASFAAATWLVLVVGLTVVCTTAAGASRNRGADGHDDGDGKPIRPSSARSVVVPAMTVLRNATALAAHRASHNATAVLFAPLGWAWCDSCRALRNATDTIRRSLVMQQRQRHIPLRTDGRTGKAYSKAERARIAKLRSQLPVDLTVFDCTGAPPLAPGHPCTTEAEGVFPTLVLYQHGKASPAVLSPPARGAATAFADVLSVNKFLRAHVAALKSYEAPEQVSAPATAERPELRAVQTSLARLTLEDIEEARSATADRHTLAVLHPSECLQCGKHLTAIEAVAAGAAGALGDSVRFARAPLDAAVRTTLGIASDGPVIVLLSPGSGSLLTTLRPLVYTGPLTPHDLLAFVVSQARVAIPPTLLRGPLAGFAPSDDVTPVAAQMRAVASAPRAAVIQLDTPSDITDRLLAEADAKSGGRRNAARTSSVDAVRMVLFGSHWTASTVRVATAINSFAASASAFAAAESGIEVDFFLVDLTDPVMARAVAAERRITPDAAPHVMWCRAARCADEGLKPFEFAVTTPNVLAFIRHEVAAEVAAGQPSLLSTAVALDALVAPTAALGDSGEAALRATRTTEELVDHVATLEPLAPTSDFDVLRARLTDAPNKQKSKKAASDDDDDDDDDDEPGVMLPASYYDGVANFYVLVTFHNTPEARRESTRALERFKSAASRLRDERRVFHEFRRKSAAAAEEPPNATLVTIDGGRFYRLAYKWSQRSTLSSQPFVVLIQRTGGEDGVPVGYDAGAVSFLGTSSDAAATPVVPDAESAAPLLEAMLHAAGHPGRFDKAVMEVTPNSFIAEVLDETKGVLLLIRGRDCPHSLSILPSFAEAAGAFTKDQYQLTFASMAVEDVDEDVKRDMAITHFPQLRWYAKGLANAPLAGELVDTTPYREALIEFVSEEMGFAHMDLQGPSETSGVFSDITSKDFAERVAYANNSAILLYVYSGRALSERRLNILRRVGWHFKNFTIGTLEGADALATYIRADPDELTKLGETMAAAPDDQAFEEDDDEPLTPQDVENFGGADGFGKAKAIRLNPPKTPEQIAKSKKRLALQANKVEFLRIDATRYRKAMTKHGFGPLAERSALPALVFLPLNVNKELGAKRYPADAAFNEIAIARWTLEQAKLDPSIENEFTFSDEELANERDPPLVNVADVDQSNFFDFMGDAGGDRVVLYYAQWCRHSQNYLAAFAKAAEHFGASADDDATAVKFGRVDVPNNAHIGHHQGIQSFPTVIVYFAGSKERALSQGEVFRGAKTAQGLISYVERIRGTSKVQQIDAAREKRLARIQKFNADTFAAEVERKRNYSVIVEFSTTWCGHCRHAEIVLGDYAALQASAGHQVVVARIDAEEFSKVALTYNATANFPVITIFPPLSDDPTRPGAKLPNKRYLDARFLHDMADFFEQVDPLLKTSSSQRTSFDVDRDREDSVFIDKLTARPKKASKKSDFEELDDEVSDASDGPGAVNPDGTPKKRKATNKRGKKASAKTKTTPTGEVIDIPGGDGVFQGFPEVVQRLTDETFGGMIAGRNVALILHYSTPGDEAIMTTYGVIADALKPAVKRGMLRIGALEAGNSPALLPFLGKSPTLTLFRGFAHPNKVRYDDSEAAILGDGGSLDNATEVIAFVHKHLNHSSVTSLEINDAQFDRALRNVTIAVGVFFYAPYCEECQAAAAAYDEVAQMLGHRDDVILTRIDISRHPRSYRMLGSPKLPSIAAYDAVSEEKAGAVRDRRARIFDGPTVDRPTLHRFLLREVAEADARAGDLPKQSDSGDDGDVIIDDLSDVDAAAARKKQREQAVEDREVRLKMELIGSSKPLIPLMIPTEGHLNLTLHDFPKGVLCFLTANWCPHCNSHLRTFSTVVPALQDLVAVASFDVSAAPGVLERFGVLSVPAYVFVSKSEGTHHVYSGRQKTAAAITKWALKFAPSKPDKDLPLYSEVPEDYVWGNADKEGSDAHAKAQEEARKFPATIITTEAAARRALDAAAAEDRSDKRKAVSATVLFLRADDCSTPRCMSLVDNANRVASGLRHSEMIVGVVNVSFGGSLFAHLNASSLPTVHIRCGAYAATKAVSALSAPMKLGGTNKKRVSPDVNLIERISSLVDAHCLTRQPLSVEDLSQARRALDADSRREEARLTLRHLRRQRAKESAIVFLRPRVCADGRCDKHEQIWEAALKAAKKRTAGAEGAVDYVRVDLNEQGNKVLRKVLFQRRIDPPTFAYLPMDVTADAAAVIDGEPSVELGMEIADALQRFVGELSMDGLIEFIQRRHRKEHG